MIKLILADMDGTLLNDKKQLTPGFIEFIHKKYIEEGILFGVASGRQYYNLYEQMKEIKDEVLYIAENGMYIAHGKKELLSSTIHKKDALELIQLSRTIKGAHAVICGKKSAYIESDYEPFIKEATNYYAYCKKLDNLDDFMNIEDEVLKISIWSSLGTEETVHPIYHDYYETFNCSVSTPCWMDIMPKGIDKGVGVKYLQEYFTINQDETAVFGDYLNDYEMLQNAYHSYAMKNAHPKIKEICNFETKYTNNEDGVYKELIHLLGES